MSIVRHEDLFCHPTYANGDHLFHQDNLYTKKQLRRPINLETMPPTPCSLCHTARALVKRPKTGQQVCKDCFFEVFETEVHNTIVEGEGIFKRGERVAIGASGGKGSFYPLQYLICGSFGFLQIQLFLHTFFRFSTSDMTTDWICICCP